MNRKKQPYDRYSVGERLQKRRLSLGLSQEALAERIDRAAKYYSDIERGICGMSVETMLVLSKQLDISLDYMMFGKDPDTCTPTPFPLEPTEISRVLVQCNQRQCSYAACLQDFFSKAAKPEENE